MEKQIVSSDSQAFRKDTIEDAILALNMELAKYPRGEKIDMIQVEVKKSGGEYTAKCIITK